MKTINRISFVLLYALLLALYACSSFNPVREEQEYGVTTTPHQIKAQPRSRYGNPDCYSVDGKTYYVMTSAKGYCKTGLASWYGTKFHGKNTSSREPYDMFKLTVASRNLPLPTYVEVTNLENGKKIIAKVNDRGPFKPDRIIDLSYAAATKLGFANRGTANVQVRAIEVCEMQNAKNNSGMILANNKEIPEIEINPIALPQPTQGVKEVLLERYLQLGAFLNKENAVRLKNQIRLYTEAPILIKEGALDEKTIYRVQIGPFKSSQDSDTLLHLLNAHGFDVITVFS